MKLTRRFLLISMALLAACQPFNQPPQPTAVLEPQPLAVTWPAFGEAVDASPVLQWEPFPGATHYEVWVLAGDSAAVQIDEDTSVPQLAVSSPLPKGTGYNWTVQAQDAQHSVLAELNSYFVVKADLALVRPAAGAAVDGAPVLEWEPFAGAAAYQVIVLNDGVYPPEVVVEAVAPATSFALAELLTPGSYSWTVRAQDAQQAVLAELNSTFTVIAPLAIVDPAEGAQVGATPILRWTPYEGATQYQVLVVPAEPAGAAAVVDTVTKGTELWVNPPLAPDTRYALTVQALDRRRAVLAEVTTDFGVFAIGPFTDCSMVHGLPAGECQALLTLYQTTGGATWADGAGWLANNTPCDWPGVTCTAGHVTDLNLFYQGLQGGLPLALTDLTHLRVLALRDNQLTGPIPPELGRLEQLVSLDLSRNQLSGSLPAELGQLETLEFMFLQVNQLSGQLPPAWGALPALRHLDLGDNALTGAIPAEWGQLAQLQSLRLGHNQLSGSLPEALGGLAQLTEVDVSNNQLTGPVPAPWLVLSYRALWGNQLDGTTRCDGAPMVTVAYQGVSFTCVAGLAASVWPEVLPAVPAVESAPFWEPRPAHVRFTLAGALGADQHFPLGAALTNQAQVLVFPADAFGALDREIRLQIRELRILLDERPTTFDRGLPLLPLTNASRMLTARAHYLNFQNGAGLAYLTQYAMGPSPANNQELLYTFQGLTADEAYYVAVYFPVRLPGLPDSARLSDDDFARLMADYPAYLAETTAMLEAQPPEAFGPDLAQIDLLIESLSVH